MGGCTSSAKKASSASSPAAMIDAAPEKTLLVSRARKPEMDKPHAAGMACALKPTEEVAKSEELGTTAEPLASLDASTAPVDADSLSLRVHVAETLAGAAESGMLTTVLDDEDEGVLPEIPAGTIRKPGTNQPNSGFMVGRTPDASPQLDADGQCDSWSPRRPPLARRGVFGACLCA
mmetsp:Transcript_38384/g.110951  ORF Transcript_38384/g.110951 Transcript_38384/m.110951 type:complete len:177 (+) Transcript_38384:78-608(+)